MTKNKNKRIFRDLCNPGSFCKSLSKSGFNNIFAFGSRSGSDSGNRSGSGSVSYTYLYYTESYSGTYSESWCY